MKSAIKNLKKTAFVCAALISSALITSSASAANTPATVPTSFLGTYSLTYTNAQPGSPLTNGTPVEVILGAGGTLCIAGFTLSNPVIVDGNAAEAVWVESTIGVKLGLSNLTGSFNEINLATTSDIFLGQLAGSKTSSSTVGCGADLTEINELFELAQEHFAEFFPAATASATLALEGFTYRYYSGTSVYLAINDGQIYVMGGTFGSTPSSVGSLESVLSVLTGMDVDIPDVDIPEGNSTLVITGTASGFAIPAITIDNLPMPGANDIEDMKTLVREQFEDVGVTGDITVTLISSDSNSIKYNLKFNGSSTQSGQTLNQQYDLTFTYTKK